MAPVCSLQVNFSGESLVKEELNKCIEQQVDSCLLLYAESCRITEHPQSGDAKYALIFVPALIVDSSIEHLHLEEVGSSYRFLDKSEKDFVSERLLSMIHPFLARNFPLKAIIPVRNEYHAPSDIVLLDLSHTPAEAVLDLLDQCPKLHSGPDAILTTLLVDKVQVKTASGGKTDPNHLSQQHSEYDIPSCPVCLHRIDPRRLGLNRPTSDQLCSRLCPPPPLLSLPSAVNELSACPRQRLLAPWPRPSVCSVCHVIQNHWSYHPRDNASNVDNFITSCQTCGMKETLWVCLTCAFVGCGRYSNKHAAEHFYQSGHPFCLELSTLRIWDYEGEFTHRADLLECPSSPPLLSPWIVSSPSTSLLAMATPVSTSDTPNGNSNKNHGHDDASLAAHFYADAAVDGKTPPKKATMIGEEYEALLQSALEEQAQHFEGEITRLRAELTATAVTMDSLPTPQQREVDQMRLLNQNLRTRIDAASQSLLDLQSQDNTLRSRSQQLLRDQQFAKEQLKKVRAEVEKEQKEGKAQVEELEQQIADLTANQRMRQQFTQDEELLNAQLFGTMGNDSSVNQDRKKGKKNRRNNRRK